MRLIDAAALAAEILDTYGSDAGSEDVTVIYGMVINAPTIDAVPVIRCKDCKYREVHEYHYKDIGYRSTDCTRGNEGVIGTYGDSGYCSLAERKEAEDATD